MKRFFKKTWKGIPIGIIATVFLCTAVLAATVYFTAILTITQEIKEPWEPPPPDYGEVLAPDIDLSKVDAGSSFSQTLTGAIVVNLGPDGEGELLRMVCAPDDLYTDFDVTATLTDKPEGSGVGLYGYGITGGGEVGIQLDLRGTYIFDLTIAGKAGNTLGAASSTITFTLEEYTGPPPPP